mgnify:CR=1 FL=1
MSKKEVKNLEKKVSKYQQKYSKAKEEISKVFKGQEDVVESVILALLSNGHVLLEGIPGIGKTLLVRTLSKVSGADFSRIQFTPDLLPTDIVGIETYEEGKGFYTVKGPVFSNFILGDEINRSPPKVQSALLEAMQERQVTIGKETFDLPSPFLVMATQNPLEQTGTYELPEAQLDRFLFKIIMTYPEFEQELNILESNTTLNDFESFGVESIFEQDEILESQQIVKHINVGDKMEKYMVRLVDASRNPEKYGVENHEYVDYGASPRASIGLFIASKAKALMSGKTKVTPEEVRYVAKPVLRHRIVVNFEGEALGLDSDEIVDEIIDNVKIVNE